MTQDPPIPSAVGSAVDADIRGIVVSPPSDPADASVIPGADVAVLVERHGLGSAEDLALAALRVARELARPPISGYHVAAVGIEAETGALVLGANLEFPGTELGTTIHAEGFVPLRVRRRGRRLAVLALSEARPCAHCRQLLSEAAGVDDLRLIDLLGNRRTLDELYPWPFRPTALGVAGDDGTTERWPDLALDAADAPPDIAGALLEAGVRSHVPYSESPSAVALRLGDGRILSAGALESVAFNPSVSAAQAAMVELAAARATGADVTGAWLARTVDGPINPEPGFRALLGAVAPAAGLRVVEWRGSAA